MRSRSRRILFWLASWTWGLPLEMFGALVALGLLITGRKPAYEGGYIAFRFGDGWGGLEGGTFIFLEGNPPDYLVRHEKGHGLQNLMFGWLTPLIITIPSAVRYWHRRIHNIRYPSYYSIWFEKQASDLGARI